MALAGAATATAALPASAAAPEIAAILTVMFGSFPLELHVRGLVELDANTQK